MSCSTRSDVSTQTSLDRMYISNGIEKYFMGQLPNWANFSEIGKCQRSSDIYYLDFKNLYKSYALKYEQMINLQQLFNKNMSKNLANKSEIELKLKEQSFTFLNAYELIIGGSRDFKSPTYKEANLLWIDPLLNSKSRIKEIVKSPLFLSSHPILVSTCLTNKELAALTEELKIDNLGALYISAEMFSIFTTDDENNIINNYRYSLDLNKLLPGKELTLFGTERPDNFFGKIKYKNIKK